MGGGSSSPGPTSCPPETPEEKRARAKKILAALKKAYRGAKTELAHENAFQLLVATVLSAQSTDKGVNRVTPELFRRWPTPEALAKAEPEEVGEVIRTLGLWRNKAKNLVALAKRLVEEHGGQVPADKKALMQLPGVGWKTATVVAGAAFGIPGIAVDTHVARVARRLCLSQARAPEKIAKDLEALFPKKDWVFLHHALVLHGRYVCKAQRPRCEACVLRPYCPSASDIAPSGSGRGRRRRRSAAAP